MYHLNTVSTNLHHPSMVTVDQVMSSLKKVVDPELHKDIVSMGMIKDLAINDGKVAFTLQTHHSRLSL